MTSIWLLLAVVNANVWLLPVPADKLGWGLRLRPLEFHEPYLLKESIEHNQLAVVLINQSREMRQFTPLGTAHKVRDLKISLLPSTTISTDHPEERDRNPTKANAQLPADQFHSWVFRFPDLRFHRLQVVGDYEMQASLKTAEGVIVAPVFKFKVIEPTADDILVSQAVPLEGYQAKWPMEKQDRAVLQQIKIGKRTWLVYRKYYSPENGGKVKYTRRIAELPGKVLDLKVEGSFGDWNPLTITYRATTYTKFTTTHVINSVDGRPWTAEEEKHRQEKLKREGKLPVPDKK